jgi:hypothetical protein
VRPDVGVYGLAACLVLGCTPTKDVTASPEAGPSPASSAAVATTTASAPVTPALEKWTGTYVSTAGSLYVFDGGEYAGVWWRGDEAGDGLGEGPVSLTLDRKSGTVRGVAGGPIGDVVLTGALTGDAITASVLRKDPLDRGLTGTAVAKAEGDHLVGTMRLSVANARVIREASLTLTREKP